MKTANPGVAATLCDSDPPALAVSDYVCGRLDPPAARDIERRARCDGRLAASILEAKAVRRRVERRLSRRQTGVEAHTEPRPASAAHSSARTNAPFTGDAVPVAGPFAIRPQIVRGFA
jgi:anti-sigma-K factor RskA